MTRKEMRLGMVTLSAALFLLPAVAGAQAPPGALPPRPGAEIQKSPAAQDKGTIRVRVELVTAPVVVRDEKGEMVVNLNQSDFRLLDNNVEQKIDHFDMGGDPLSVVLVVETSTRVKVMLPAIQKAGIVFTQTVMGEGGEGALISFGSDVQTVLPFTKDAERIEKSVGKLDDSGSQTRLYDALAQAVRLLHGRPAERRRVIVALTEASDMGSEARLGSVLREAQLENVTIYTIGLSTMAAELRTPPNPDRPISATPPGIFGMPPRPGQPQTPSTPGGMDSGGDLLALGIWIVEHASNPIHSKALQVATAATGGDHIPTFKDRSIEQALSRVGGELHAEYTLGYHPTGVTLAGYHNIRVEVNRTKSKVRTRPGYFLTGEE
jgi:VWFA-related protein